MGYVRSAHFTDEKGRPRYWDASSQSWVYREFATSYGEEEDVGDGGEEVHGGPETEPLSEFSWDWEERGAKDVIRETREIIRDPEEIQRRMLNGDIVFCYGCSSSDDRSFHFREGRGEVGSDQTSCGDDRAE